MKTMSNKTKNFVFPSVMGIQGGRMFYSIMLPMKLVSQVITIEDNLRAIEERVQRKVTPSRKPGRPLVETLAGGNPSPRPLSCFGIGIEAIAQAFAGIPDWKSRVKWIERVDFDRESEIWEKIGVVFDGKIMKSKKSIDAMAAEIQKQVIK